MISIWNGRVPAGLLRKYHQQQRGDLKVMKDIETNRDIMKAIIAIALSIVLVICFGAIHDNEFSWDYAAAIYHPGTYEASARGFGGDVDVTVTVDKHNITDIQVTGDHETENIGSVAIEMVGDRIMEAQDTDVDTISGATVTSMAVVTAASTALGEAATDVPKPEKEETEEPVEKTAEELDVDIVIVGAGGAGMTAAIKSAEAGKNVLIVEKMPYAGGNTTRATGGMNAAETHYQKEQGIDDTVEQYVKDTMEGGHNLNDPALVQALAEGSAPAIDWLDSIGAQLPKIAFTGGSTNPRAHALEDGSAVGIYLVSAFKKQLEEKNIPVLYNTTVTEIIMKDGRAVGVKADSETADYTINAKAVILATGGFGGNEQMIVENNPALAGYVSTNAPGATGDGIVMAQEVGADVVDMDQIQLHPTVEQRTRMLITEAVRGNGAILVNKEGKRFVNEMETRDFVSAAEIEQTDGCAYVIFDQNLRDNVAAVEKYFGIGVVSEGATIEDLAGEIGLDPVVLSRTLADWNKAVANQKDPEFGRTTAMDADLSTAPYYAILIAPGIHHTMGGLKIDVNGEVLNTKGKAIPGLFAAGEVTGGVHGGNRLGGNAVADVVVFGTAAAESACTYTDKLK